jgi:hypothetical protein
VEVMGLDLAPAAFDDGALDEVAQLPNVSRVVVGFEALSCGRAEARQGHAHLGAEFAEEVLGQEGDVFSSLAKGRDREDKTRQAEIEVLAEVAGFDLGLEIRIGGREHTHVHLEFPGCPQRHQRATFQHPQQLGLQPRRHVTDLIQEQGASIGIPEVAFLVTNRPGEGPLEVAEEERFGEILRDRGAIDGEEGGLATRAAVVDSPGDEFLAGATLADDEHGGTGQAVQFANVLHEVA